MSRCLAPSEGAGEPLRRGLEQSAEPTHGRLVSSRALAARAVHRGDALASSQELRRVRPQGAKSSVSTWTVLELRSRCGRQRIGMGRCASADAQRPEHPALWPPPARHNRFAQPKQRPTRVPPTALRIRPAAVAASSAAENPEATCAELIGSPLDIAARRAGLRRTPTPSRADQKIPTRNGSRAVPAA